MPDASNLPPPPAAAPRTCAPDNAAAAALLTLIHHYICLHNAKMRKELLGMLARLEIPFRSRDLQGIIRMRSCVGMHMDMCITMHNLRYIDMCNIACRQPNPDAEICEAPSALAIIPNVMSGCVDVCVGIRADMCPNMCIDIQMSSACVFFDHYEH